MNTSPLIHLTSRLPVSSLVFAACDSDDADEPATAPGEATQATQSTVTPDPAGSSDSPGAVATGTPDSPPGKRPVMLIFDDNSVNQFRIIKAADGQLTVDSDCAIAIMQSFFSAHPDFGRGGHYVILPDSAFSWPDAWDQQEFAGMTLHWLVDNGYELGNHTIDHDNLALVDTAMVQYQLAEAEKGTQKYIPDRRLKIVNLPYGGYPNNGDDSIFNGFIYEGVQYTYEAVLLVGANPAFSPVSTEYHLFWITRIQAFDEELGRWQEFILENPGIMYVSDGNPDTVTIPNNLGWNLLETLDESQLKGRELIRY